MLAKSKLDTSKERFYNSLDRVSFPEDKLSNAEAEHLFNILQSKAFRHSATLVMQQVAISLQDIMRMDFHTTEGIHQAVQRRGVAQGANLVFDALFELCAEHIEKEERQ